MQGLSLIEVSTLRADDDIIRMPPVLCEKIPGEKVYVFITSIAPENLYPQKVFHRHPGVSIKRTVSAVEASDLIVQASDQRP